jgi:type IV pilus assembly protein PilN
MIKINLLSEGRRPVVARRAKASFDFGGQDPNNLLLIAGLVLGALVAGGWWYKLNAEINAMDREIRQARARYEELRPIIEQVAEFKKQNEDLERKVNIIKDLKAKQKGPVTVMDSVSRALPELVWLDSMTVTTSRVDVKGKAFNTNAIAAFIENLAAVPEFEEPNPQNIRITGRTDQVYSFQMNFDYRPPKSAEEAAADGDVGQPG